MWLGDVIALGFFMIVPTYITSLIDQLFSDLNSSWFRGLNKPMWIAPNCIFQNVWTLLLLFMGLASFIVWETPGRTSSPLSLYFLLLLFMWSLTPIFFCTKSLTASLVIVSALVPLSDLCAYMFLEVNLMAGLLFAPLPIWLIYIAYLHFTLYYLNEQFIDS